MLHHQCDHRAPCCSPVCSAASNPDAPPDSGLAGCTSLLSVHPVAASDYPKIRPQFAGSRWPDLRTAGTAYVDPPERTPPPMIENPSDTDLVTRAATGDQGAWHALVDRYAPLIWPICREHSLSDADARTIGRAVWLQLVSQLGTLSEPAALAGWLATTTRRECGKSPARSAGTADWRACAGRREHPGPADRDGRPQLPAAERDAVLREAFTHLPPCCQRLIAMLTEDPPVPDAPISATLGIPVGSIGPSRSRCLDKLRQDPALATLINPGAASAAVELSWQGPAR